MNEYDLLNNENNKTNTMTDNYGQVQIPAKSGVLEIYIFDNFYAVLEPEYIKFFGTVKNNVTVDNTNFVIVSKKFIEEIKEQYPDIMIQYIDRRTINRNNPQEAYVAPNTNEASNLEQYDDIYNEPYKEEENINRMR